MDKSFATESQKRGKCCYNNGKRPTIKFDCSEKSVSPRACSTQNEKRKQAEKPYIAATLPSHLSLYVRDSAGTDWLCSSDFFQLSISRQSRNEYKRPGLCRDDEKTTAVLHEFG